MYIVKYIHTKLSDVITYPCPNLHNSFVNSMVLARFEWHSRFSSLFDSLIDSWGISNEIALRWLLLVLTENTSTFFMFNVSIMTYNYFCRKSDWSEHFLLKYKYQKVDSMKPTTCPADCIDYATTGDNKESPHSGRSDINWGYIRTSNDKTFMSWAWYHNHKYDLKNMIIHIIKYSCWDWY